MTDKIVSLCQEFVKPDDRVVVAVSGGADSMCLAHAMALAAQEQGAALFIAHVNHQLRGQASEQDARFVCAWAKERSLPRLLTRVVVQRRGGQSEENVARNSRYRALVKACRRFGANKLATAHTADDQVETFLLNLLRGSGGRGLQGMPPRRPIAQGIELIRPLLAVRRRSIEAYCLKNCLSWRNDASNDCLSYRRNRIRLELLPQLRDLNPGIDRVLLNTIKILQLEQSFLEELSQKATTEITVASPLPFAPKAICVKGLTRLAPALQNRIVLSMLPKFAGVKHVQAVLALAAGKTGASLVLPGGMRVYRLHDALAFGGLPIRESLSPVRVSIPGQVTVGGFVIVAKTKEFPGCEKFWLPGTELAFEVGPRQAGDYFYPPGGRKKLKDYMIDKKVPRWLRDRYLIYRCADMIFWIPGLGRDRRFTEPAPDRRLVCIRQHRIGGADLE